MAKQVWTPVVEEKLMIPVDIDANDPRAVAVQKCGVVGTAWLSSPAWSAVGRLFIGFQYQLRLMIKNRGRLLREREHLLIC